MTVFESNALDAAWSRNHTAATIHFWTVTAKDDAARQKALLTFIAGILSFVACLSTTVIYFLLHKNPSVFNSMNHLFAFAFALGTISSCNYIASAAIRLFSDDVTLLRGFCNVSAAHVFISTYPMLLCELGYFIAAYLRLRGAYILGRKKKEREEEKKSATRRQLLTNQRRRQERHQTNNYSSPAIATDDVDNNNSNADYGTTTITTSSSRNLQTTQGDGNATVGGDAATSATSATDDDDLQSTTAGMIDTAIHIVDSGEAFFRRYCGISLVLCLALAMVLQAVLPVQSIWQTKFDPSDQSWCWIPTTDGSGDDDSKDNGNAREVDFMLLQLFVEVIPLVGTPIVGIFSLVALYKSLGSLPRSAKARIVYIVIFLVTFGDSIFVRLQFTTYGASRFQAFAEPFIACMNAITFLVSEIYPTFEASRPRRLGGSEDRLLAQRHFSELHQHSGEARTPSPVDHDRDDDDDHDDENGNDHDDENGNDDHEHQHPEPTLAVAIEAAAFLQTAMLEQYQAVRASSALSSQQQQMHDEIVISGDREDNEASNAVSDAQRRRSRKISQKLYQHAIKQRDDSTIFILVVSSFLSGFIDVWSFVSFGTFTTAAVVANVGVVSLAVAYSSWVPELVADHHIQVGHHAALCALSIVIPVVVASIVTRILVKENKIIDREHSMAILGFAVLAVFLTWVGSLPFFSVHWFDHHSRRAVARYAAVCGLSTYSGFQLAYHRIFLALFKLPSEPFLTSTLLDFVSSSWLTPSATVVLTAASAERFPSHLRRRVQSASAVVYLVGCMSALFAGVYETGGAFCVIPILATFVLLLSLDWSALDDQVLIPERNGFMSAASRRSGRRGLHHQEWQQQATAAENHHVNYSSQAMFAREIESCGINDFDNDGTFSPSPQPLNR